MRNEGYSSAKAPYRSLAFLIGGVLTVWVWALGLFALFLRWNAFERPGPPVYELFPYGEVRIGVDASYPPFAAVASDDLFGLDIDLGRALAARLKVPVRFVNLGYDGIYDAIRADQVDVVISALLIDPSRTAEVLYTQPYFNAGLVIVSGAANPIETMQEIPGHSLAFEFGSEADEQARLWARRVEHFEVQPYELPQHALDAVRLGIADAALVDAVSYHLYRRDHRDWRVSASYLTDAPYAIAIRIDRYQRWEAVSRALQAIIENGTLDDILRRWL